MEFYPIPLRNPFLCVVLVEALVVFNQSFNIEHIIVIIEREQADSKSFKRTMAYPLGTIALSRCFFILG